MNKTIVKIGLKEVLQADEYFIENVIFPIRDWDINPFVPNNMEPRQTV